MKVNLMMGYAPSINPLPVNPGPEEFQENSRDKITLTVVPKNTSANKCGDESESDDGVEVCMESRDVTAKKSEVAVAIPKPVKTPEELKADELKPAPDPNGGELKLQCPFPKCNELFVNKPKLVDHYIESHSQSSLKLSLIRALAPERFCLNPSNRATITLLGDDVREVFSCPQCEVQFVELQLQARHVARHSDSSAAQCDHCRNFVKVGEKEQHQSVCHHRGELERIKDMQTTQKSSESKLPSTAAPTEVITIKEPRNVQIGLKVYPCTHKHGGCKEVFPEKAELHKHARKCKHRPNTIFSCGNAGCTKRYYYKADYEKHVDKFHSVASEALPSTSTSSTSVICTPTLHFNLIKQSKPVPTKEITKPLNTCTQLKPTGNEALPVKKYQCRFCAHQYVGDDDLREHLLDKHTDRFKAVECWSLLLGSLILKRW